LQDPTKLLLTKFFSFAKDRLKFERPPRLFLRKDSKNAKNALGRTAHYDPQNSCITVFISKRHPKDVIRSFAHELVHHCQNERGDLKLQFMKTMNKNYAQENEHMRKMEKEAYLEGNMCFRDWEDSLDNKLKYTMSIAENIYLKENKLMNKQTNKQKELTGMISKLLERKLNILIEQNVKFKFPKARRLQTIIASGKGRMKIPFDMEQINSLFGIEGDQYTKETYNAIADMQRKFNEVIPDGPRLSVDGVIGSNTHRILKNVKTDNLGAAYRDLVTRARAGGAGIHNALSALKDNPALANVFGNSDKLTKNLAQGMAGAGPNAGLEGSETPEYLKTGKLRGSSDSMSHLGAASIDGARTVSFVNDYAEYKRGAKTAGAERIRQTMAKLESDPTIAAILNALKSAGEGGLSSDQKDNLESVYGKYFPGNSGVPKAKTADDTRSARISSRKGKIMQVTDDDEETQVAPQGKSPQTQKEGKITKAHLKSMIQKILQEKLEDTEEIDEGSCAGTREDKKSKKKDCSKCPGCPECKPGLKKENEELEEGEVSAEVKARTEPKDRANKADFLPKSARDKINKKNESKIQTPEQENSLYESRFTQRNTRLFEKLLKEWTK